MLAQGLALLFSSIHIDGPDEYFNQSRIFDSFLAETLRELHRRRSRTAALPRHERGTSEKRGGTERTNRLATMSDERRPERSGAKQLGAFEHQGVADGGAHQHVVLVERSVFEGDDAAIGLRV